MTERAAYLPFVHEHAVRSALCQVEKRGAHVPDAGKRSHGDAVIHGYDNGAVVVAVKDAFKPDLFSEIHGLSPLRRQAGVRVAKKKTAGFHVCPRSSVSAWLNGIQQNFRPQAFLKYAK